MNHKILLCILLTTAVCPGARADHEVSALTADTARGQKLYNTTCVACHGPNGKSVIPGVPNFAGGDSRLAEKDRATLVHNVDRGIQSPGSTMAMPAKGGNPSLSTQDIVDIIAFMQERFAGEG